MKRVLLTFMVIIAGLSVNALDINAQNTAASRRQQEMEKWKNEMAEFKARSQQRHEMNALVDSIARIQAAVAVQNQDFVLEADQVTFKTGNTVFVNSNTTFISVKGNKAVVQISPSNFASGPNGVGGVTVSGTISGMQRMVDKKGRTTVSFNVMGIGINAQVEVYLTPGTNQASATIYPNFNSNTVWIQGQIVPYENSDVFEGTSL
jgi:ATPase subunit of ABC transporter with duplicated ATPase domains